MKIVDISQGWYEGMPSFGAAWYPQFSVRRAMTPQTDPSGVGRTFSNLEIFPHNGTHIESGYHFYPDGEKIDEVPLETFVGTAFIADLSHKNDLDPVTGEDLDKALAGVWERGARLLVRTDHPLRHLGNDDYWDTPPYLTPSAADWAVDNGAVLVGMDCITEKPGPGDSPVHRRLLAAGVPILENIQNMHLIESPKVRLVALPVKIADVEAAPSRAIVLEDQPA
ncbi:cyclase family protein [Streptomyces sp. TR1341]|uniref:cyclase family protein n=1 Tax=Streptomyces sp. TR1341 TaxID=2601266 RepID=UPI00138B1753|nr:cyclase family protein [Streptomyces sp. TR1341]